MGLIDQIITEISFWAVLGGFLLVLSSAFRELNIKEGLFFCFSVLAAVLVRIKYGFFAPVHAQDHYVQLLLNLKENKLFGSFFDLPQVYSPHSYPASGGLYELIYQKIMFFLPGFDVYYVYYINIGISVAAGIMAFVLGRNLFKSKAVGFISFYIFAFLPFLMRMGATEVMFFVNALTILLFINLVFYILKNKKMESWHCALLLFVFCANLLGRKEYLVFFPVSFFLVLGFLLLQKRARKFIFSDFYILLFLGFCLLVSSIYFIEYVAPYIGEVSYGVSDNFFRLAGNSFLFWKDTHSYLSFLKDFFTPFYFSVLFLIFPLILAYKKYWTILFLDLVLFVLIIMKARITLADSRFFIPFIFLVIPQIGYVLYFLLRKTGISGRLVGGAAILLIIISTVQNWQFLNIDLARRVEQDLLMDHMEETVPKGSLILTVADKKYETSEFERKRDGYRYYMHGNEFSSYLVPESKEIDVMDLYTEYDRDIIEGYDNVFYYKSLYSHHGKADRFVNLFEDSYKNPDEKTAIEATRDFENAHGLAPIEEKLVKNIGAEVSRVDYFIWGINRNIEAEGDLKIGLYKVKGFGENEY